ncbi:MAG TPA: 2-oxo-4-hydroxy-4-carboxy-5-ureidoimidazoline decarboxylase [Bryobacteraceae bacterium]|nr:2-oxo-4-hydroxy-4-carboxy-5-ureidoimidazoline decarboxylase [Bryobacteraceae bacterium]
MTLAELNALDHRGFIEAIGWVFEDSPWVAEQVCGGRPYANLETLHQAMVRQVEAAAATRQLALLCAHPDLGTRAHISAASIAEQAGAGLDRLTPEEFQRLQELNTVYRRKFGFPFLFAVKGSTKYDILKALERRILASPEEEHREALRQVYRIAEFRLRDTIK